MATYWIHSDGDGTSQIKARELTSPLPATNFFLKEFPVGTEIDWHPAPRRMVVIILSGELENEFRDGTVHRFGPGDIRVVEDVDGEGHRTRVIGVAPCEVAVVALADLAPSVR